MRALPPPLPRSRTSKCARSGARRRLRLSSAERTSGTAASVREDASVRYRARVEYDGTDFAGFQVNPGRRTVQGELEAALARLDPTGSSTVDAAGRTDAGVHAAGQVIAFTYRGGSRPRSWDGRSMRSSRRTSRSAPDEGAGRLRSPLCGAVSGVPLHRLERAAQPAPRASRARGAGPARCRGDGASRVGPHRPARLPGLRGDGSFVDPDRSLRSGSGGTGGR